MKKLLFLTCLSASVNAQTYCSPPFMAAATGCIHSVKLSTLYNSDPCSGAYGYLYSGATPVLYRDSTYTLELSFDSIAATTWVAIAIPFDTGANKYTFSTVNRYFHTLSLFTAAPHTYYLPVTIPHDAALGSTRLRIVRYGAGSMPRICNDGLPIGTHGESQDYTLNIGNIPPPNITLSVPVVDAAASIYPNPTSGIVNIPYGNATVINALGQIVYTSAATSTIDLTTLPAGTYYVKAGSQFATITKQ